MSEYEVYMSNKEMPITLAREIFIDDISNLINRCGLHPIIIEPILKDLLKQVQDINKTQLEKDKKEWEANQYNENQD